MVLGHVFTKSYMINIGFMQSHMSLKSLVSQDCYYK